MKYWDLIQYCTMPLSHDQLVTDSVVMENYSFSFFCHFLIKDKHMPVRSTGEPPVTMKLWRRLHCDCQSFKLPYGTSDPLSLERLAMLIRSCHQRQLERQVDQCMSSNELAEDRWSSKGNSSGGSGFVVERMG